MVKTKPTIVKIIFFIDSMIGGGKERRLTELMKALKLIPGIQFELVVMSRDIHYKEVFELGIQIHYLIMQVMILEIEIVMFSLTLWKTFFKS